MSVNLSTARRVFRHGNVAWLLAVVVEEQFAAANVSRGVGLIRRSPQLQ